MSGQSAVARRYRFHATHHVEGLAEPWSSPHGHGYTVEVVAELDGQTTDLVVDTDALDEVWALLEREYGLEGSDLNESTPTTTTVEDLARWFLAAFGAVSERVRQVTVWEDEDRWGRARR